MAEKGLGLFLLHARGTGHTDDQTQGDGPEDTDAQGVGAVEKRRGPTVPDQKLADGDSGEAPSHGDLPDGPTALLHVFEDSEGVGHEQDGTPPRHVDHRRHRRHVDEDADVQPDGPRPGRAPRFDQEAGSRREDQDTQIGPERQPGHVAEVTENDQGSEGQGTDGIGQEDGAQAARLRRFFRPAGVAGVGRGVDGQAGTMVGKDLLDRCRHWTHGRVSTLTESC